MFKEFKRVKGKERGKGRCSSNLRGLKEKREERVVIHGI